MVDVLTKADVRENDMVGDTVTYDEWDITATIAECDQMHYRKNWRDDELVLKFGTCSGCGEDLASWAKHAICPKCDDKARLS